MTIPRMTALLVAAAMAPALVSPVFAQARCGPRDEIVRTLGETFKEAPIGIGIAPPGQVVELFASTSGSWTMVVTNPNGTSCLVAAGENWDMVRTAKGQTI